MSKPIRIILIVVAIAVLATLVLLATSGKPILWQPRSPAQPDRNTPTHPTAELLKGLVQGPQRRELKSPVSGTILALGASETMPVAGGQLIAQVDSPEARESLRAARIRLKQVQAQTGAERVEATQEKLRAAEGDVQTSQANVAQAAKQLEEFSSHNTTAVAAQTRAAQAQTVLKQAVRDRQKAQAALAAAQARSSRTGQRDAGLESAQREISRTTEALVQTQSNFTSAMQTRVRLREQIAEFVRLQRGLDMRKRSASIAEKKLQALKQTPSAVAAERAAEVVSAAQAEVARAERVVAGCAVMAEGPGRLTELRVRPGMKVRAGQTVALVDETGEPRLVFEAPAACQAALVIGQRASVAVADAKGGGQKDFSAAITQIVAVGERAMVYLQPLGKVVLPPVGTALTARLQ